MVYGELWQNGTRGQYSPPSCALANLGPKFFSRRCAAGGPQLYLRCSTLSPDCSSVLKALPAIHRAPLRRLEWNGCFLTALRANRFCLHPLDASGAAARPLCAIGLARSAPLRLVLKAL